MSLRPKHELRTLDSEVAVTVFGWRLLFLGNHCHQCYPFPPEDAAFALESGWQPAEKGKPRDWSPPPWLPRYSEDPAILLRHFPQMRHRSYKRKSLKTDATMTWYLVSGGGVTETEWDELAPALCIHAIKIASGSKPKSDDFDDSLDAMRNFVAGFRED